MLKDKINSDLLQSFKNKDAFLVGVLRLLAAAIKNKELEKRTKLSKTVNDTKELESQSILNDDEVLEVITKESKKIKESIVEFEKASRMDLAEKEKKELMVLKKYLPEELTEEELIKIVGETIKEAGDNTSNFGKIMSEVMKKVKGRASGDLISKIVKEILNR